MLVCRTDHLLDCTPTRFWQLYFDPEFLRILFLQGLGWSEPKIDSLRDSPEGIVRAMGAKPKLVLAGKIADLVADRLGYTEEGRYDRARSRFTFVHRTNLFGDRLDLGGTFDVEPVGETRCRRRATIEANCRIFGIGGLLERAIEVNVQRGYDASAKFTNHYCASHPG